MIVARTKEGTYKRWDGIQRKWYDIPKAQIPDWSGIIGADELPVMARAWREATDPRAPEQQRQERWDEAHEDEWR